MFLVHKKGFVTGGKMVGGLVPYDFFCEDDPAINLFVFTGAQGVKAEQTLWAFSRLERFEAMTQSFQAGQAGQSWFQRVSVLTGPSHNGTSALRFQDVTRVIRHEHKGQQPGRQPEYEIQTLEGDRYFTCEVEPTEQWQACVIYQHQ